MNRSLLKPHASLLEGLMHFVDPLCVLAAGLLAHYLHFLDFDLPARYVWAVLALTMLCALLFPRFELYRPRRGESFAMEIRDLARAWISAGLVLAALLFATQLAIQFSRLWVAYLMLFGFCLQVGTRGLLRLGLRLARQQGYNLRHVFIAGAGRLGAELATQVTRQPSTGFHVSAFYDDDPALAEKEVAGVPVLGNLDQLIADLDQRAPDQVWIALPLRAEQRIRWLLDALREHSVQVSFVPDIHGFHLLHHSVTEVAGVPFLNLTQSPIQGWHRGVKRAEDLLLTVPALIMLAPIMLVIALAVKLSSPGPIFYRQERVTWNGGRFTMLKFRTMPLDAEASSGPVWARPGEQRATPLGTCLRRLSLDELPQLLNVLAGEMSLVGPRPERPEFVASFRREIPGYMQKHLVKAGITGWAQVNDLRGSSDLRKRIQYDLYYIDNWSVWFDLRILALTLLSVWRSRNAC
ncbi:MAG: undecaprenyl-phosphate glucose phosphotransferase [Betaproteobacteria bacterium]|nr:undecaprenyl-phosphate glucose phosphotransferase [Betaproteobacteria bacterium]